jgi:alpha-beta hydrolase superfamily lysophospholipase
LVEHPIIRRTESHVAGVHGHTLFRRAWLPERPERVLLVVHGYAEHSGRYEPFGAWFAARGCAVHSYDHQGHGRSTGPRCHVRRFADLLDDLELVLGHVRSEHPERPVFLVGHSMGGLTVAAFAADRRPDVAGAVTSGAALAISEDMSRGRLWASRLLRWIVPRLAMPSGLDANGLSRDPDVVRAYLEDPLVFRTITMALAAELMSAIQRTGDRGGEVRVPMLLLHGEADPICPVDASRSFHAQLDVPESRLRTYPGLRHEVFNEPEHESVFEDLLEWVREREAALRATRAAAGGISPAVQMATT